MEQNEILDSDYFNNDNGIEIELVSPQKFMLLFVASLGLYGTWWQYKSWRLLQQKDGLDILPVWRAIFAIIFLLPLLEMILRFAKNNGYDKSYSPGVLYIGFILVNLLGRLPEPLSVVSLFAFMFLVPGVAAFNYALKNSSLYNTTEPENFNSRQMLVLLFGAVIWLMIIGEMFTADRGF